MKSRVGKPGVECGLGIVVFMFQNECTGPPPGQISDVDGPAVSQPFYAYAYPPAL
jgi:hypothetical protein